MMQEARQPLPLVVSDVAQACDAVRPSSRLIPLSSTVAGKAGGVLIALSGLGCAFFAGVQFGPAFGEDADASAEAPFVPCISLPDVVDPSDTMPESFDTRTAWLGCGAFVVDQGQCGDCWAASGANTLGDRACIHLQADGSAIKGSRGGAGGVGATERMFQSQGRCVGKGSDALAHQHGCDRKVEFPNPQKLVSCGSTNRDNNTRPTFRAEDWQPGKQLYTGSNGCNGGSPEDTWRFFYHEGLSSFDSTQKAGCTTYTSGLCSGKDPSNNGCRSCEGFDQCADTGLKPQTVTVHSFGFIMDKDMPHRPITSMPRSKKDFAALGRQVRNMQTEIMTNGPLHVCIDDYANFGTFFNLHGSGVYNSTEGTPMTGGHCIELIGWGVDRESRLPFWFFKNSWGPTFASAGFGRWLRGVDLCGIESDVYAGCPSGSNCELTAGVVQEFRARDATLLSAAAPRHPDSAERPSRTWHGGKEHELTRSDFSHGHVAPLVVEAVRKALNDPSLPEDVALWKARRVWSRSVRGLRVRVELEGHATSHSAHRHVSGEIVAL